MTMGVVPAERPGILRRFLALYAAYPLPLLAIALVYLPFAATPLFLGEDEWVFVGWVGTLVVIFVHAAMIHATAVAEGGEKPVPRESYRHVFDRWRSIISVEVRYLGAVALLALTIIGIPFAIRLGFRWIFGVQGVILEDLSPKEAFGESIRLVQGKWRRILGIFLLVLLLALPNTIISFAIAFGALDDIWRTATWALTLALMPVAPGLWTLAYLQLREEKGEALARA